MTWQATLTAILQLTGAAGVAFGAWLAWEPGGWVVGGAFALAAGLSQERRLRQGAS